MKITKAVQKFAIPALIFVLAILIYVAQRATNESDLSKGLGNQCTFVNLACEITHGNLRVSAQFINRPEAEESITVNFSLPDDQQIASVWIEGVNMYMGKVPVLVEQNLSGEWSGWFMLGACSEPNMRWKMLINIEGRDEPLVMFFNTKMP